MFYIIQGRGELSGCRDTYSYVSSTYKWFNEIFSNSSNEKGTTISLPKWVSSNLLYKYLCREIPVGTDQ